jgi:hypothetical protein
VPKLAADSAEVMRIDAVLGEWRQGDLALEEHWFIHVGDPEEALTNVAAEASGAGIQALPSEVAGLVVVSQTCDIVRSCAARPYVEVAPLVSIAADDLRAVQRGRRPGLATLPALLSSSLAADLDRVMTVEKSIVAKWQRTPGYTLDADRRAFAQALARKRVRFAFPDDFTSFVKKLNEWLIGKHDKSSVEGRALRALREVRVQATPDWEAPEVELFFWFLRNGEENDFEGKSWAELLGDWLKLVPSSGRFTPINGAVVALDDMSGAEYVGSDALDLDYLSTRAGDAG